MSSTTISVKPKRQWKKLVVWGPEETSAYLATLPEPTPEERASNKACQNLMNLPVLTDEELDEWEDAVRSVWRTT